MAYKDIDWYYNLVREVYIGQTTPDVAMQAIIQLIQNGQNKLEFIDGVSYYPIHEIVVNQAGSIIKISTDNTLVETVYRDIYQQEKLIQFLVDKIRKEMFCCKENIYFNAIIHFYILYGFPYKYLVDHKFYSKSKKQFYIDKKRAYEVLENSLLIPPSIQLDKQKENAKNETD